MSEPDEMDGFHEDVIHLDGRCGNDVYVASTDAAYLFGPKAMRFELDDNGRPCNPQPLVCRYPAPCTCEKCPTNQ